eukprot:COSAG06_NODE_30912_length_530_cov_0.821346_2_plen_88_part_01
MAEAPAFRQLCEDMKDSGGMPDGWVHPVAQGLIRCVSIAMEILSETLEGVLPQSAGPSKDCPCAVLSLRAGCPHSRLGVDLGVRRIGD